VISVLFLRAPRSDPDVSAHHRSALLDVVACFLALFSARALPARLRRLRTSADATTIAGLLPTTALLAAAAPPLVVTASPTVPGRVHGPLLELRAHRPMGTQD
jgi:hypothetical protein